MNQTTSKPPCFKSKCNNCKYKDKCASAIIETMTINGQGTYTIVTQHLSG
jgi:hypothetical protein